MINWSGLMHYHFIAEPMRDTTDTLLGNGANLLI